MAILSEILIPALFVGMLVGFYELDKKINRLLKNPSKISNDLFGIKIELENISAEMSNLETEISLLRDKIGH